MADSPSELQFEIEKLERKHAEHPEGRFFVPLANAYRKMGDVETAEALLRSGVERHPDYLSAHIVLGRCLADRGAIGEAEEEFRFVLSQDPQNLIALRTLGELAVADGRAGEAAEWYRELLAVDPMNEDARQALDSLSDAPASAELESEFRSGAGWWEPGADAATESLEASPPPAPEETAAGSDASDFPLQDEIPLQDEMSSWAGYDDLPGLREDAEPEPLAGDVGDRRPPPEQDWQGERQEPQPERFAASFQGEEPSDFAPGDSLEEHEETPPILEDRSSEVVTETIAELYARQGLHDRAAAVYRELIRRRGGDTALEQRLAEIERLGRADQGAVADLALEDDEALASPPLDADEDPFVSTFAGGFETEYEGEAEAQPALEAARADSSIAEFLADLARWRPAASAAAGASAGNQRAEEAATATEDTAAGEAELGAGAGAWEQAEPAADEEPPAPWAEPWETAPSDALPEPEVEPWESGAREADEGEVADLPYLEDVAGSATPGGTGPAGEEPFPWELPGAAPLEDETPTAESTPTALDPFFVDDVEPPSLRSSEPLPEAAPPPEGRQEAAEPSPPAPSDAGEDEDLESFQAWLRSLKR